MTWFEPDQPDPPAPLELPLVGPPTPRRTPWGWPLASSAVTLVVGLALGFVLGSARSVGAPAPGAVAPPSATLPAPATVTVVTVRSVATPACLETATRGDELIDLLVRNRRSRAADLLGAYTIASRQCRRDADP